MNLRKLSYDNLLKLFEEVENEIAYRDNNEPDRFQCPFCDYWERYDFYEVSYHISKNHGVEIDNAYSLVMEVFE